MITPNSIKAEHLDEVANHSTIGFTSNEPFTIRPTVEEVEDR